MRFVESFESNRDNTTSGLTSAYQITQVTGGGLSVYEDTAGYLNVGFISLLPKQAPPAPTRVVDHFEIVRERSIPVRDDPALAKFSGPLGVPRTHTERAELFRNNYRIVAEEVHTDIPEDCL
jgi:hypothetical protein